MKAKEMFEELGCKQRIHKERETISYVSEDLSIGVYFGTNKLKRNLSVTCLDNDIDYEKLLDAVKKQLEELQ